MAKSFDGIGTILPHDQASEAEVQPNSTVTALRLIGLMLIGSAFCILIAIIISRIGKAPGTIDLPQAYLPGSPFSTDAWCKGAAVNCPLSGNCYRPDVAGRAQCPSYSSYPIKHDSQELSVTVDNVTRAKKIVQTSIPAHEYTMGDLLLAWGRPTGFIQDDEGIYVYWGARSAYLIGCSFWPGSHLESITYSLQATPAPPWRGFVRRQSSACRQASKT